MKLEFHLDTQKKDDKGSPIFCHTVMLEGIEGCSGEGYSKKESQQKAAKLTLEQLKRKPQFLDSVFTAKSDRTKMEEEPVQIVPETEQAEDFIVISHFEADTTPKAETDNTIKAEAKRPTKETSMRPSAYEDDEFDLTDISMQHMSREDIIAAAEQAAWEEE